MRKLSGWAYRHKWTTRIGIVVIYILLNAIGFFLGDVLSDAGISIPGYIPYLLTMPFLIAFILYPSQKEKAKYKHFYRSRKIADAVLAGVTFLLIICMNNLAIQNRWPPMPVYSASAVRTPITAETNTVKETIEPKKKKNNFSIKQFRKKLRANIQELRKEYRSAGKGDKVGLIILSVIVAIGLLFLLAVGSCSIACSGSEGLAWVVFLLGTGLIVFLLVRIIRRIKHGPQHTSAQESTS